VATPIDPARSPFERAAAGGLVGGSSELVDDQSSSMSIPKKKMGRRPVEAGDWAPEFLSSIVKGERIIDAAAAANVHPTLAYRRRKEDELFRKAWNEASEIGTRLLEQEAQRRAFNGVLEPVFHKGQECGTVRKYSDTLLIFLLKARNPAKYRDGVEDGVRNHPVTINVNVIDRLPEPDRPAVVVQAIPEPAVVQAT
jgi:hypothetical protein